jgi:hypothetical protein
MNATDIGGIEVNLKQYIGDGVYADYRDGYVVLTTEDGISTSNTIYLDDNTLAGFQLYLKWLNSPPDKE